MYVFLLNMLKRSELEILRNNEEALCFVMCILGTINSLFKSVKGHLIQPFFVPPNCHAFVIKTLI